ncbi:M10 family metallopeptidase C-terminal domain-containing protein, partial [Sphingomonas sediminicola]
MADIPGDVTTTAIITVGQTISDSLEVVGDHDWFRLNLTSGQAVTVSIHGVTLDDSYLRIYDINGNMVYENDDISDANKDSLVSFAASYTGVYYVDVGSWDDRTAGTYQVSVKSYVAPGVATLQQVADQLKYGYWGDGGHHFNVTSGGSLTVNLTGLTAAGQNLARAALATWTDVIGVTFREVSTGGQITFDDTDTGAATSGSWANGISTSAHVNIGTQWLTDYGTSLTSYSFQTYIHEIGHALGLGHAGNYNGDATYPYDTAFSNDGWPETVMSYFDQTESTYFKNLGFTKNFVATPMMADVLAATQMYGMSTTTRVGDTVYGPAWTTTQGTLCIVDSAGNDTIDVSAWSGAQTVNLNQATFSNVLGEVGNISIAPGTTIENAITGSGNDTLIGNEVANVLTGGLGADTLTGGAGNDIFKDSIAGHSGDTITDFSAGDVLLFTDAGANFTYSLSGRTLTYSGGSLTFGSTLSGSLVAAAAAGGGIQLTLGTATTPLTRAVANDFNGDGKSDVLWRNDDGTVTNWLGEANGNFAGNAGNSYNNPGPGWTVAGTGDFNGDGHADILWRNTNGDVTNWLGTATGNFTGNAANSYNNPGAGWTVAGIGDFNGDGHADILWRNTNGDVTNWLGTANGNFAG